MIDSVFKYILSPNAKQHVLVDATKQSHCNYESYISDLSATQKIQGLK